jgi:hypothetical protein
MMLSMSTAKQSTIDQEIARVARLLFAAEIRMGESWDKPKGTQERIARTVAKHRRNLKRLEGQASVADVCPVCGAEGPDESCQDEFGLVDDHAERHAMSTQSNATQDFSWCHVCETQGGHKPTCTVPER